MSVIIPFQDIYAKAIGLFDDPKITAAYNSNLMQFYKLMYVYLQNSISLFNNPLCYRILSLSSIYLYEHLLLAKEYLLGYKFACVVVVA